MPALKEQAENCQRVSVAEAAAEIGCHPQYLRQMMRTKKWDLGSVVLPQKRGGQCMYLVFRSKLDRFLGLERGENIGVINSGCVHGSFGNGNDSKSCV